jgi:hypothetical protein
MKSENSIEKISLERKRKNTKDHFLISIIKARPNLSACLWERFEVSWAANLECFGDQGS